MDPVVLLNSCPQSCSPADASTEPIRHISMEPGQTNCALLSWALWASLWLVQAVAISLPRARRDLNGSWASQDSPKPAPVAAAPFHPHLGLRSSRCPVPQKPSLPQGPSKPIHKEGKKEKCCQTGMSDIERRRLIQTQRCCGKGEVLWLSGLCPLKPPYSSSSNLRDCLSTPSAEWKATPGTITSMCLIFFYIFLP